MNESQLKQILPRASRSTIDLNVGIQDSEPERSFQHGALAASKREEKGPGRAILSYTSYRRRMLDIDNLAGGTKFLTDALRYCGAIPDDTENEISLQVSQKKVKEAVQEKTLIEIQYFD